MHTRLPAQMLAHRPQCISSLERSTQELPHSASPGSQLALHAPLSQTWPIGQRLPHVPQLLPLDERSTQMPPPKPPPPPPMHSVVPAGQMHLPIWQVAPLGQKLPQ